MTITLANTGIIRVALDLCARGRHVAVVFQNHKKSRAEFEKVVERLGGLGLVVRATYGMERVTLPSGGVLRFLGSPHRCRGLSTHVALVHSSYKDDALAVIQPMLATTGGPLLRFD